MKKLKNIKIELIVPSKYNVRMEDEDVSTLMSSIDKGKSGILQPITVEEVESNMFEIVFGNQRYEACKNLGYKEMTCIIRPVTNEFQRLEDNIRENLHRTDVSSYELGRRYVTMKHLKGLNVKEIAVKFNKTVSSVRNCIETFNVIPKDKKGIVGKGKGKVNLSIVGIIKLWKLSLEKKRELYNIFHELGLTVSDAYLIGHVVETMKDVNKKEIETILRKYRNIQIRHLLLNKKILEVMVEETGLTSAAELIRNILVRKVPYRKGLIYGD